MSFPPSLRRTIARARRGDEFVFALAFQKLEINGQGLQRINNRQQCGEHADKESQLLTHDSSAKKDWANLLTLLLRLELLEFSVLLLDLSLLGRHLLLHGLILLLPCLHLVTDQGAAD